MTTNMTTNSSTNEITYTNENKPLAILNPENICFKCLQKYQAQQINSIYINPIYGCGYGDSEFNGYGSRLDLCTECYNQTNSEWWKLEKIKQNKEINDYTDYIDNISYKYEEEIIKYLKSMPIEGQELFFNMFAIGYKPLDMESQDWIDYTLEIISHENCRKYDYYYSPDEKKAYYKMYPKCQHPVNLIKENGYNISICPFGSKGKYNQEIDDDLYIRCYECQYYQERISTIKDINEKIWNDYNVWYTAKINIDKYKELFEKEDINEFTFALELENHTEKDNN